MKKLALRHHLSLYWSSYLGGGIVLAVLAGIALMSFRVAGGRDKVANWPIAKAEILKSEFATTITQDQTGSSGHISAKLLLRCSTPEKSWTVHYLNTWPASSTSRCKQL